MEKEPSPTYEKVVKSFENSVEETKGNEKSTQKKEARMRPLSDSNSTSPVIQPQRKRNSINETKLSNLFSKDAETSIDSSKEDNDLKSFTDRCCYELIQNCTGRYFGCACESQYYKCSCCWKTTRRENGTYKSKICHRS